MKGAKGKGRGKMQGVRRWTRESRADADLAEDPEVVGMDSSEVWAKSVDTHGRAGGRSADVACAGMQILGTKRNDHKTTDDCVDKPTPTSQPLFFDLAADDVDEDEDDFFPTACFPAPVEG